MDTADAARALDTSAALASVLHGMRLPFAVVGLLCCPPTGVSGRGRQMAVGLE